MVGSCLAIALVVGPPTPVPDTFLRFHPQIDRTQDYRSKFTMAVKDTCTVSVNSIIHYTYEPEPGSSPGKERWFQRIRTFQEPEIVVKPIETERDRNWKKLQELIVFPKQNIVNPKEELVIDLERQLRDQMARPQISQIDDKLRNIATSMLMGVSVPSPLEFGSFFDLVLPEDRANFGSKWEINFPPFRGFNRNAHFMLEKLTKEKAIIAGWMENSPLIHMDQPYKFEIDPRNGIILRESGTMTITYYPIESEETVTIDITFAEVLVNN